MKKQLIKQVEKYGKTYYFTVYNEERVTEYRLDAELAIKEFKEFKPEDLEEPGDYVIMEEDLQND